MLGTRPRAKPRRRPVPLGRPWWALARVVLLAGVGVVGAAYGLWRAIHFVPRPMVVPAPSGTEIPAPEIER